MMMPGRLRTPLRGQGNMKIEKGTVARLLRYMLAGHPWLLALVMLCILLSALAGVVGSLFLRTLLDTFIVPLLKSAQPDLSGLARVLMGMAALYAAGIAATLLYNRLMVTISQGVQKTIRDEMFAHMQKLPVAYFDTHSHGDAMSLFTNDADALRQMLSQSVPQMFAAAVTIVAVLCAMLATNLWLALLVLCISGGMFFISRHITKNSGRHFVGQQRVLGSVNGYVEENIHGQQVVKLFGREQACEAEFNRRNEELFTQAAKANTYANILMPIMGNIGHLQVVLLAVAGGMLALSGTGSITLGGIVAFIQLSRSFSMPVNLIAQQLNMVVLALAGAGRIFTLLNISPEENAGKITLTQTARLPGDKPPEAGAWAWQKESAAGENSARSLLPLQGEVTLQNVSFAYTPGKPVLKNISLHALPGQKVAFVGATGAGKTTIANLLNRFYDITQGEILYDGININEIRKQDLRRSLGVVLQDTHLFTATVAENIRYGRPQATGAQVEQAAKLAGAHEFILRLPRGYDTLLAGDSLSQGQRQLLSIARTALFNPPVMVLDEATSSIDTRTEAIVAKGMDSLMKGRTVFVIAHRLSTVRNADVILVLYQGEIVERGSHEELLLQKGRYFQLYSGAYQGE